MDSQKKNTGIIILIVVLSLLVVGLGGYLIYDKFITKDSNIEEKDNTKKKDNSNIENNNFISKIDEAKDWIHDADYDYNVSANSYSIDFDITYYVKDIIAPYINIKSADADKANAEIKEVFDEAIKAYNNGVNNKLTYVDECKYTSYVDENKLSVNFWLGIGATDVVHPEYYTYNFDLKTGKLLSYEEVYNSVGFNSNNITEKLEKAITDVMKERLKELKDLNTDNSDGAYYPEGTNFNTYNNESISNYKKEVFNNSIKYFLDTKKKLNVIVTLSIPIGTDEFDTIIIVD